MLSSSSICLAVILVISVCFHVNGGRLISQKRSNNCIYEVNINGCSTPTKKAPYKKTFTPACNGHDVCYSCGEMYGISRSQCDDVFRDEMYKACEKKDKRQFGSLIKNLFNGQKCKAAADAYYIAVDNFGSSHYDDKSPSWCLEKCVVEFLDLPNKYSTIA